MSKKDYIMFAQVVRDRLKREEGHTGPASAHRVSAIEDTAYALCRAMKNANGKFDEEKFLDACGIA